MVTASAVATAVPAALKFALCSDKIEPLLLSSVLFPLLSGAAASTPNDENKGKTPSNDRFDAVPRLVIDRAREESDALL